MLCTGRWYRLLRRCGAFGGLILFTELSGLNFARKAIEVKFEHIFELKYVKDGATDAEVAAKEAHAAEQLKKYLAEQNLLKAWILVFRGVKCVVNREFGG